MAAIFNSPSKYIQGPDELAKLGSYVEPLGAKALVIVTPSGKKRVGAKIEGGFAEAKAELLFEDFNGECSKGEVDRLVALARDNGCDIIVGVGGGKILDTAKAVAYYLESPVIICPTIASTDAPCSALSVLYTDDGQFDKYLFLKANPNIVLMDTTVIAA
ncbi:MAG: iron-containing alcohol dehydrogenase, partial [Collinsella aerofaciens]|nr:iron-containing alcohol dehydrogenase [Collinsella aerofaciens]